MVCNVQFTHHSHLFAFCKLNPGCMKTINSGNGAKYMIMPYKYWTSLLNMQMALWVSKAEMVKKNRDTNSS